MTRQIYTCERCGKVKVLKVQEGQNLEDVLCDCEHGHSHTSDIANINEHKVHQSSNACGCGGSCGCN
ncbi:MAG: hypothetical protein ABSG15_04730 [FCB group bacterium]|jgi:lysyl-tRNA synthetase class I